MSSRRAAVRLKGFRLLSEYECGRAQMAIEWVGRARQSRPMTMHDRAGLAFERRVIGSLLVTVGARGRGRLQWREPRAATRAAPYVALLPTDSCYGHVCGLLFTPVQIVSVLFG